MRISIQTTCLVPAAALAMLVGCADMGSSATSSASTAPATATSPMSFFVTSRGVGKGADLGGVSGADRHCQALAAAAGVGGKTWRAYLSTTAAGGAAAGNARDRIGGGPWRNARGDVIAMSVEQLHGPDNNLNKQTALTEKGEPVKGSGDTPNEHDILTGSTPDGRTIAGDADSTCRNWTSSTEGAAMLGHHDRRGLNDAPPAKSWNSSHLSRGCSQDALRGTGGAGLFYCFAAN